MIFSASNPDLYVSCPGCGRKVNHKLWIECEEGWDKNGELVDTWLCPDIGKMQELAEKEMENERN